MPIVYDHERTDTDFANIQALQQSALVQMRRFAVQNPEVRTGYRGMDLNHVLSRVGPGISFDSAAQAAIYEAIDPVVKDRLADVYATYQTTAGTLGVTIKGEYQTLHVQPCPTFASTQQRDRYIETTKAHLLQKYGPNPEVDNYQEKPTKQTFLERVANFVSR